MTSRTFFSRWVSLGAALIISSCAGTGYAFGIYSQSIQSNLKFSQSDVDLIASVSNCGLYLGVVTGLIYGRIGPFFSCLIGSCLIFLGFFFLHVALLPPTSSLFFLPLPVTVGQVCCMGFCAQFGSSFLASAATSTSVRNFPIPLRGQVAGLLKGMFGLASSVFAQLFLSLYNGNKAQAGDFLLFMAIFIPAATMIAAPFVNLIPTHVVDPRLQKQARVQHGKTYMSHHHHRHQSHHQRTLTIEADKAKTEHDSQSTAITPAPAPAPAPALTHDENKHDNHHDNEHDSDHDNNSSNASNFNYNSMEDNIDPQSRSTSSSASSNDSNNNNNNEHSSSSDSEHSSNSRSGSGHRPHHSARTPPSPPVASGNRTPPSPSAPSTPIASSSSSSSFSPRSNLVHKGDVDRHDAQLFNYAYSPLSPFLLLAVIFAIFIGINAIVNDTSSLSFGAEVAGAVITFCFIFSFLALPLIYGTCRRTYTVVPLTASLSATSASSLRAHQPTYGSSDSAPGSTENSVVRPPLTPTLSAVGAHPLVLGSFDHDSALPIASPSPSSSSSSSAAAVGAESQSHLFIKHNNTHNNHSSSSTTAKSDMTLLQALLTPDIYLVWIFFFCAAGSGLVVINNVTQISYAFRDAHSTPQTNAELQVTLIGLGNFAGRVSVGFLSDKVSHVLPRPLTCALSCFVMSVCFFFLSFDLPTYTLYIFFPIIGICYGGLFGVVTAIAADLYGSSHHAANYGFLDLGPSMGSLFFSTYLVNVFYSDNHSSSPLPPSNSTIVNLTSSSSLSSLSASSSPSCFGYDCFRSTFIICCCATFFGSLVAFIVYRRTRLLYRKVAHKHLELMQQRKNMLARSRNVREREGVAREGGEGDEGNERHHI